MDCYPTPSYALSHLPERDKYTQLAISGKLSKAACDRI